MRQRPGRSPLEQGGLLAADLKVLGGLLICTRAHAGLCVPENHCFNLLQSMQS